jgi:hypothetical protein
MHTAEALVPRHIPFVVGTIIANFKCINRQVVTKFYQSTFETHKRDNSTRNEEKLPDKWKESIIYSFTRAMELTLVIFVRCHFCQPYTKLYLTFFS